MATPFYLQQTNYFAPQNIDILSITNGFPVQITTTVDGSTAANHNYLSGLIVRIVIPPRFGMNVPPTINGFQGTITVTSPTTFTMNFDTTNWGVFTVPSFNPGFNGTPAQVVPQGEVASQLTQTFINTLNAQF